MTNTCYPGIAEILYSETVEAVIITLDSGDVHACEIDDMDILKAQLASGEAYLYLNQYVGDTPEQVKEIVDTTTDWKPFNEESTHE